MFGPDGTEPLDVHTVRAKFETLADEIAQATNEPARSIESIAEGFITIAVDNMAENMANAIQKISMQRGQYVTDYTF